MARRKRYRVKVVVDDHMNLKAPERKYVIQKKSGFWWENENSATADKDWAYKTCEEMNAPYSEVREKMKK